LEQALDDVYGSALVQQRCIFHKLRHVRDKCVGLDRQGKKSLVEQAAVVYQAPSASEAQARLAAFAAQWRLTQPQAVATFEREVEQTIRYSSLEGLVREVVRTTSRLERTNRELRRKVRQGGCFSSPQGAEVAVYIQVTRLHAESGQDDLVGSFSLPRTESAEQQPLEMDTLPCRFTAIFRSPLTRDRTVLYP
jgi:transposase-like protein